MRYWLWEVESKRLLSTLRVHDDAGSCLEDEAEEEETTGDAEDSAGADDDSSGKEEGFTDDASEVDSLERTGEEDFSAGASAHATRASAEPISIRSVLFFMFVASNNVPIIHF